MIPISREQFVDLADIVGNGLVPKFHEMTDMLIEQHGLNVNIAHAIVRTGIQGALCAYMANLVISGKGIEDEEEQYEVLKKFQNALDEAVKKVYMDTGAVTIEMEHPNKRKDRK